MNKNTAQRFPYILLTLCLIGAILIGLAAVALADTATGLGMLAAEPVADAKFTQVTAHPATKITADANRYRISYDKSLPQLDFLLLFKIEQVAGAIVPFEWQLYRVDSASGTVDDTPLQSGSENSAIVLDSGKLALPEMAIANGQYEVRGRLMRHNEWRTFRIEVIRTRPVTVLKTDDAGKPLAGATIQIVAEDKTVYEAVSDKDGIASFDLPDGTFTVSESKAPTGYQKDDSKYNLVLGREIKVDGKNVQSADKVVTFVNKSTAEDEKDKVGAPFIALKKDVNGAPLAGATLRLEGKTEGGIPRVYNVKTDNKGEAEFTAEYGTYVLSEYAAPSGYNATDDTYDIVVSASGVSIKNSGGALVPYTPVTFINKKIPELNKDDHFAYMQGYPEGTFYPSRNMTRAEAVVMFSRLLAEAMNLDKDYRSSFYPDVDLSLWYANQVCYMQQLGVLAHYCRDEKFRPNDPVTRAEFATLAAHFDKLELTDTNKFTDVADNHWAVKFINSAAAKGWIIGYPDNTFNPEAFIIRSEVVTLVNRILERKADKDYVTANVKTLPRSYSDLTSLHWAYWDIMEASIGHDFTKQGADEKWTAVYK
jgi:hypothetical protein